MMLAAGELKGPDYFILVSYFVLMLGIGAYFYRYMKGMKDYFSGGNRVPWWLSGVSFYMASFSAFAFVFYSSLAYLYGWVAVTLFGVTVPATLVSVLFFAKRWRRARIDSPVEYLESRYSSWVRQLFAWHGVPFKIVDDALKLIATGTFLAFALKHDLNQAILFSGLIMLAYTFMGGLWAVAVTDFVQFVVLAAAILILLPLSLARAGGIGGLLHSGNLPPTFFHWTSGDYGWLYVGSTVLLYCIAYSSLNWSLIQRYFCVPRERDALKVGWLVVLLYVIGTPIMFLPAMAGRVFLPGLPDAKAVYPLVCISVLPVGMLGLIIAAMFSATMSTLSSDYNVCANVLTVDVYKRLFRPNASQRELVAVGRLMTLLVGFVSLGIAFLLAAGKDDKQFRYMITLFSIATAPVGVPMLLGLIWRRTTNVGALAGFAAGLAVGLAIFFTCGEKTTLLGVKWETENLILMATTLTTLVMVLLVSPIFGRSAVEAQRVEAFMHRLAVPIGGLPEDQHLLETRRGRHAISPFRVVGVCVLFIGIMMLAILPWSGSRLAAILDAALGGGLALIGALVGWCSPRPPRPEEIGESPEPAVAEPVGAGFPVQEASPEPLDPEEPS